MLTPYTVQTSPVGLTCSILCCGHLMQEHAAVNHNLRLTSDRCKNVHVFIYLFTQPYDCFCLLKKKSFSSFLSQALEAGSAQKNRLPTRPAILLTPALFRQQFTPLLLAQACLLFLLVLTTLVEVLYNHSHKHVQHKKADDQQERDEVEEHPGVVIAHRLQAWRTGR